MATFPTKENDVVALAEQMIAGLTDHAELTVLDIDHIIA